MLKDVILFLVGIAVGGMNAIAGGGMLIGFPALLAVGMPALAANITSNIIVVPGQLASVYGYRRYLRQVPRRYLWLLLPCAAGAAIGAEILRHTSSSSFQNLVPGLIFFAVVLFAFQPVLHFHLHRHMHSRAKNKPDTSPNWPSPLAAEYLRRLFWCRFWFCSLGFFGVHQPAGYA